jgi:hypothetical protein
MMLRSRDENENDNLRSRDENENENDVALHLTSLEGLLYNVQLNGLMYNLMDFFQTNRAYPNQPRNRVRIRKL